MGSEAVELKGPDLKLGVPHAALAEGKLLGHADGEPVLLVRTGGSVFAVSNTCTHYSGPLSDGLIEGSTVRCPWHHACFDLRTGIPSAPALNAIATWNVKVSDDLIVVTGKKSESPPKPGPSVLRRPAVSRVVIVGGGATGMAAVNALRRSGYDKSITLLSAEESSPVDRPNLSKEYLAGTAPDEWIPLRPPAYFTEQHIDLRTSTTVESIAPDDRTVSLSSGEKISYDALVLCTGSTPIRLPIPGAELPHVFVLRSYTDSRRLIEAASRAKRVAVIGASFIGLEVAASMRAREREVHVIAPETRPLEKVMGADAGDFVRRLHERHGVAFHLGRKPLAIEPNHVRLDDGSSISADVVVMGVGVRPNTELAEKAGLSVDHGVLVNEYLETSAGNIFAGGDIARWPYQEESVRIEHWVVAERQGEHIAKVILGERSPYQTVPFFWSAHYHSTIRYTGYGAGFTRTTFVGDLVNADWAIAFWRGDEITAVATVGRDQLNLEAEAAFERGEQAWLRSVFR